MTASVTVVVPTFRRPDGLALALKSVLAQTDCAAFDLLVVDNDPGASARSVAGEIAASLPAHISMAYIHEPSPGVANARNAAIASVRTRYVAFIDDDQSAAPDWLSSLLACAGRFPAAVTFGPVRAVLPEPGRQHESYLTSFFSRPEIGSTGHTPKSFGCGNSLVDMQSIPPDRPVFDMRTNETGGEDDLLFDRVRKAGGRFAWCQEAVVMEHVPVARAQLQYTLRRALAYGQGPVTLARRQQPPNWLAVLFWMAVGAYKVCVNSLLYAWGWLTRSPSRAWHLDRAARGLGKICWWVQLRFYGAARI